MCSVRTLLMRRLVVQRKHRIQIEPAELGGLFFGGKAVFARRIAGEARLEGGAKFISQSGKLPIRGGHCVLAAACAWQRARGQRVSRVLESPLLANGWLLSQCPQTGWWKYSAPRNR